MQTTLSFWDFWCNVLTTEGVETEHVNTRGKRRLRRSDGRRAEGHRHRDPWLGTAVVGVTS